MKHFSYAFHSDELYLSKWDLVKLFFGWRPNLGGLKLNPKTHVIHQSEPEWEEADRVAYARRGVIGPAEQL